MSYICPNCGNSHDSTACPSFPGFQPITIQPYAPRPLSPEERCLAAMPAEVARHPEGSDVWAKMMLETANRAIALVAAWKKEGRC